MRKKVVDHVIKLALTGSKAGPAEAPDIIPLLILIGLGVALALAREGG